jgi:hypothetical protein
MGRQRAIQTTVVRFAQEANSMNVMQFLTIRYNGWKMEINDDDAILTKNDERCEIHKTGGFERSLRLARNKVDRMNKESKDGPIQ